MHMAVQQKKRTAHAPLFEVHVFLATGTAKDSNGAGCVAGERHSLLIFARQPEGEAADERLARKGASATGWTAVKLERSKRLPVTARPQEPVLREAFDEALRDGYSIVAHRRQEDRAPGGRS